MERLLETVSFEASDKSGTRPITVNAGYVDDHLTELSKDEDLSRYILCRREPWNVRPTEISDSGQKSRLLDVRQLRRWQYQFELSFEYLRV